MPVSTVRRLRIAMGTWLAIEATAKARVSAIAAVEAAIAAVDVIQERLHPWHRGSDLQRINEAPLHAPQSVHASTWELLTLAKRISLLTDGVFDPCLPTRSGTLADVEAGGGCTVICHTPVALDFGGIAKGYAIDCAVAALMEHGCTAGLVNAGGDLRVFGRAESILIRRADGAYQRLEVQDTAVAVTDLEGLSRPSEHQGYYIRGFAGTWRPHQRHAVVLAREAATADALTKCVLLCPETTAGAALRALGAQHLAMS
jgi:thiamine biosynthesis lipoprotein